MTREEAISIMNVIIHLIEPQYDTDRVEDAVNIAIKALEQQPKTGHWIVKRTIMHDGEFYCDVCDNDAPFNKTFHFCPNCGARMVESQESEDKE